MHQQRPQDRLRGEVPLPPLVPLLGKLLQILVDPIEDLRVVVQNPDDPLVLPETPAGAPRIFNAQKSGTVPKTNGRLAMSILTLLTGGRPAR